MSKPPTSVITAGAVTQNEGAAPVLLEYQSPTAALIARPVPLAARFTTWVVASLFAALLAVMSLLPIDRVVTAAGKVTATTGNLMVQPLETAIVRSIEVKEGQLVHAGDTLAQLDPTFAQADAGSLETQVASLSAEVTRLTAETQGRIYQSDGSPAGQLQAMIFTQRHGERTLRLENYRQKIEALTVKAAQAESDVRTYTQRLALASEVESKRRELERLQVGSQLNRLAATDARVDIESRLAAARSEVQSSRRDLAALVAERDGYVHQNAAETSQQLTEQGRKLADAREQFNKAALRRTLVQLRADRDAIVLRIAPVSVGTVMQTAQEFIELVPLDAPLQIEAAVDGRDVGFVRVGDPVTLKFETFPYALYGTAEGTVRSLSPDSFKDPTAPPSKEQVDKSRAAQAMGVLFFRAKMSIDAVQLHDLPEGARIVPGMPVTADIRVGKRTIIGYLMSRFIPAASEGMREP
ncbi:Membrane fusion protein (MFP) family protein [Rhodovastum atsumiense]|uniref:HlyD family type I secretion periplasmic adaptor subunit n=1 Tax=Rhodovastum atsumiense TaxID=504468 RepID=UPI0020249595|nr:HlyD family type I secretion periplasmic adaptor subunit [Rhodovastum atsumiense]CAH2599411.1 Membrane fusion protein (MFP) family protein [Rhodovastum atsumiense]